MLLKVELMFIFPMAFMLFLDGLKTQLRLEAFYTFNERFAKIRSKRIKKAVKGITGNKSLQLMDDSVQDDSKSRKKAKVSQSAAGDDLPGKDSITAEAGVGKEETNSTEKSTSKQSRKRRNRFPSEARNSEPPIKAVGRQNTNKGYTVRGSGRGRVRGQSVGRGRRKQNSGFENAETSSSDEGNNCDSEQEVQVEKHDGPHEVRRVSITVCSISFMFECIRFFINDSLVQVLRNELAFWIRSFPGLRFLANVRLRLNSPFFIFRII